MHAIEVKSVTKIYRKGFFGVKVPAVVDLSFCVKEAVITGFVGPNGAGKSTTIKMLNGLVAPTSGTLLLYGRNSSDPRSRGAVAYLPEQHCFYSHLTVYEMLRFTLELLRFPARGSAGEIGRVLETVELTGKGRSKIRELSKGMQQRLSMAQALLGSPQLLILDEPMSGMDPPGRQLFRELLARLRQERRTVFFSTHVLDDIETVCDDVVVLRQGQLTYAGEVRSLLEEGFLGTEITTDDIGQECREKLAANNVRFRHNAEAGEWSLFVPKEEDTAWVLRELFEQGVLPRTVVRRSMRLEELLYQRKPDTTK